MTNQRFHKRPERYASGMLTLEAGGVPSQRGGGTEVLYGRQPIREMLLAGRRRIEALYMAPQVQERGDLADIIELASQQERPRSSRPTYATLETLSEMGNHQGVVAVVSPYPVCFVQEDAERGRAASRIRCSCSSTIWRTRRMWARCLRTAEAAGVCGVVIPEHRAAGITAAVVRASAGASEHLSVAQVPNLVRCMKFAAGARGLVCRAGGRRGLRSELTAVDLTWSRSGIVVGSEGKGMRRLTRESCDYLVSVCPCWGRLPL
jgi:23S rRNA (guanosine2251-2'-O)-methyltransferase